MKLSTCLTVLLSAHAINAAATQPLVRHANKIQRDYVRIERELFSGAVRERASGGNCTASCQQSGYSVACGTDEEGNCLCANSSAQCTSEGDTCGTGKTCNDACGGCDLTWCGTYWVDDKACVCAENTSECPTGSTVTKNAATGNQLAFWAVAMAAGVMTFEMFGGGL